MDRSQSYERVLPLKKQGKHLRLCILLFAVYVALAAAGIAWFLQSFSPYVAALTVLCVLALILATRKRMQAEYEYSFFGGVLTVSKILGKSSRKTLAETDLDRLLTVDYLSEESSAAAEKLRVQKTVDARASLKASPALLLVFEREDESRAALIIETDEQTERILRKEASKACSLALKRGAPPTT